MTVTRAKRALRQYGRNGGNWRLKGLYLAGLPTTSVTAEEVAKAWPKNKSDYRFLGESDFNHAAYGPDRYLSVEEGSDGHRMLSGVAKESDWSDGPMGEKTISLDRAIQRTLAFGEDLEEFETLWQEQLMDTVIEGARKNQIARDAATVINVDRRQGTHPRGEGPAFAREVSQGGAIRDDHENYDNQVQWDTTKFGEGARATEELIDQALIDYIERQVEWLGRSCENAVNRVWLNELIDNADAANDVDSSATSNRDIAAVNEAITNVSLADFEANTMVNHPRYTQTLFDSDNVLFANRFGDDEGIRERMEFPLLGLEGFRGSNGVYEGAETWDFQTTGDTGAVVYDRENIALYMYRDIEIKDYSDPIRDLEAVNARVDVDCVYHQPSSAARIQF